jgi:hypothetical protein
LAVPALRIVVSVTELPICELRRGSGKVMALSLIRFRQTIQRGNTQCQNIAVWCSSIDFSQLLMRIEPYIFFGNFAATTSVVGRSPVG